MASFKIDHLQKALSESVPAQTLEEANRDYSDLTAKYRDLLQKEQVRKLTRLTYLFEVKVNS